MEMITAVLICYSITVTGLLYLLARWGWEAQRDSNVWREQCLLAEKMQLHWFEAHSENAKALGAYMAQRAEEKRMARERAVKGWETRRKVDDLREAA